MQPSLSVIGAWKAGGARFLRVARNPDSFRGLGLSGGSPGQWEPSWCICFGDCRVFSCKGIRKCLNGGLA